MKNRTLAALLAIALLLAVLPTASLALTVPKVSQPATVKGEPVGISPSNFPDEIFMEYVSTTYDTNNDGVLSEEELSVDYISVPFLGVSDLSGIEYFTAITVLYCSFNQLTRLDVSRNTALESIFCSDNQLTELKVSGCTALYYLECDNNQLTE